MSPKGKNQDSAEDAVVTSRWTRTAHADAWEELGRQRLSAGGGSARLPGIRVMASGLPHPQWNSGDVENPSLVDIENVRRWYARRGVPWGVRVPAGCPWPHGRKLLTQRLMAMTPPQFRAGARPAGVALRRARAADVDAVLSVDTVAFEQPADLERPWMEPLLSEPSVIVALAEVAGEHVGTGYSVFSRGLAGPCLYVAGIAVLPHARRRGIGSALSSWLLARGIDQGARLCHLHPDTDSAASVYRRLGFAEVDGLDIYVDVD